MSNKKSKQIVILLIVISVCMTATPIVMLANNIRPFVLGLPFFFFWNIFWPTMLFILSIVYTRIANKEESN
ncbi:hypothetical protein SPD48_19040 [Pseudogracilibacillus sp. SE30717A]|uniref:hypothetical protein n=1 Tax=Pseudogracilibacillus sp. SE30717A TaxID=3098293 RepID=UPI00300E27C1